MLAALPLVLSCALMASAAPPAPPAALRCAHAAAGDLVGHEIYLTRGALQPFSARSYNRSEPPLPGCVLQGAAARACDSFAPELEVVVAGGGARVLVHRLGPRLRALTLDVSYYCDPPPAPPAPPSAHSPPALLVV